MKAEAYLEFAAKLLPTTEVPAIRSCISRAYYAAFHVVYEVQLALKAKSTHSYEVGSDRFYNSSIHEIRNVGVALNLLKQARHRADYRLKDTEIERVVEAEHALAQAQWIIESVKAFHADKALREGMREAIKADRALRGY